MNKEEAISGMAVSLGCTMFYILKYKFGLIGSDAIEDWWLGIAPEGVDTIAMLVNFAVAIAASSPAGSWRSTTALRRPHSGPHQTLGDFFC